MSSLTEANEAPETLTVTVSREELRLIRSALEEFLASFSHDQRDVLIRIKKLLERLPDEAPKRAGQPPFRRLTL